MYTRCPDCLTTQATTPEALRSGRGMVRCVRCSALFDALATLTESMENAVADAKPATEPWPERKEAPRPLIWRTGLMLGLILLAVQLLYFESRQVTQHAGIRPVLESICILLDCRLPDYQNLSDLTVLHNSFSQTPNQDYVFKLVLNNESEFPMRYPNIGLTLMSYDGQPFAHRLFHPSDYLVNGRVNEQLKANAATEISLEIAATKTQVGGFHFDLGY